MSFFSEFRRRNVPQVALAYLAGAWLLLQIVDTVFPLVGLDEKAGRIVLLVLAIGFVPALVIAWVFEWTPQGIRRESQAPVAVPSSSTGRFERIIILLLVLAVAYFVVDELVIERPPDEQSLVILPFTNLSSDPEQDFFANGLARELRNLLFGLDGLSVTPHTTSEAFPAGVTVAEVRDRLHVTHVLEGSVQKSGNQVRIVAQLVDARTQKPLWSERFDGVLDDVFALQDRYAARIIDDLKVKLVGAAPTSEQIDARAYELYLKAVDIWEEDGSPEEAIALLERVLAIEPDYVPAMFELAKFTVYGANMDRETVEKRVRALVARMVEIAPASSYTNAWLGWIAYQLDGDPQAAADYYERAIADNPMRPVSMLRGVTGYLGFIGREAEAYAIARYAVSRDPANQRWVALVVRWARELDRAEEVLRDFEGLAEWQPENDLLRWHLGVLYLTAGRPGDALEQFDLIIAAGENPSQGMLGRVLALYDLGRTDDFEREFAALRENVGPDGIESVARIYAWTGDNDRAFEYLEKVVDRYGPEGANWARTDLYARLNADPRYAAFLEKYGVSEEDLSHIRFDPPFPPEMQAEIDRIVASLEN